MTGWWRWWWFCCGFDLKWLGLGYVYVIKWWMEWVNRDMTLWGGLCVYETACKSDFFCVAATVAQKKGCLWIEYQIDKLFRSYTRVGRVIWRLLRQDFEKILFVLCCVRWWQKTKFAATTIFRRKINNAKTLHIYHKICSLLTILQLSYQLPMMTFSNFM